MNKNIPIKTNSFYVKAEKYRKILTDEEEIEKINMTEEFEREIRNMVKHKEIVIINMNGKMRTGKSTAAIAIAKDIIYDELRKQGKREEAFGMKNIARDEQEYSMKMRDHDMRNNVLVIDESNALEKTGENVTAEIALRRVISDVQAGRYVHTVWCSPRDTADSNADVLLYAVAMDKKRQITRCKLYYRYYQGVTEYTQLLGYIDVYVGNIRKNWENIEDMYHKMEKTNAEEREIEMYSKRDFYIEYIIKKYEKMELITKHGIMRPRVLEYADLILKAVNQMKSLVKLSRLQRQALKDIVRSYVKMEARKKKMVMSIIGEELIIREVTGIISLYESYWQVQKEVDKIIRGKEKAKTVEQLERLGIIESRLKEEQKEIGKAINLQEEELQEYIEINRKYHREMK